MSSPPLQFTAPVRNAELAEGSLEIRLPSLGGGDLEEFSASSAFLTETTKAQRSRPDVCDGCMLSAMALFTLRVNGRTERVDVDPSTPSYASWPTTFSSVGPSSAAGWINAVHAQLFPTAKRSGRASRA